ncbi:MAG: hydroxyacid dehydrogenase [Deltaproteobacteria bacterium]|jgi:D-3-phosphoglycerate dehydrogenase|nr:hydroxyacid dehydrogenase [Deltaproteobacteria bacterium]
MAYKVLISDKIDESCPLALREGGIECDVKPGLSKEELLAAIGGYDGLIVRSATKVTAPVLEKGKAGKLKVVMRGGVGVDNIDTGAAEKLGVRVLNTPGANSNAVAELVLGFAFMLARNLSAGDSGIKAGRWEKKALSGSELSGKAMGLVGFGHIGRLVAVKAKALGMRALAHDPLIPADYIESAGAQPLGLEELWRSSDFVSLHLPKNEGTLNMVGPGVLSLFKPTAFLINCARGGLVDEGALYEALAAKKLAGAAFDVFAAEPPGDSPLLKLPNFIAAPHLGASTGEAQMNVARMAAERVLDFFGNLG